MIHSLLPIKGTQGSCVSNKRFPQNNEPAGLRRRSPLFYPKTLRQVYPENFRVARFGNTALDPAFSRLNEAFAELNKIQTAFKEIHWQVLSGGIPFAHATLWQKLVPLLQKQVDYANQPEVRAIIANVLREHSLDSLKEKGPEGIMAAGAIQELKELSRTNAEKRVAQFLAQADMMNRVEEALKAGNYKQLEALFMYKTGSSKSAHLTYPQHILRNLYPWTDTEIIYLKQRMTPQLQALQQAILTAKKMTKPAKCKPNLNAEQLVQFVRETVEKIGFDFTRGLMAISSSPMAYPFNPPFDIRLTTMIHPDSPAPTILGAIHEAGHGIAWQGLAESLANTPASSRHAMWVEETQSRLYEMFVGRAKGFWQYLYPQLQAKFPAQLHNVPLESFYRFINEVDPREPLTGTDEITFMLSIFARFDIEQELHCNRNRSNWDLRKVWRQKMKEYRGILPRNADDNFYRDVPKMMENPGSILAYLKASLYAVQLYKKANGEITRQTGASIEQHMANGNFNPLKQWLNEKINRYGSSVPGDQLIHKALGVDDIPLDKLADDYLDFLWNLYGQIYPIQRPSETA